eukprot:scaffold15778_cov208-Isochrysis_galbana.AAC.3
MGGIGRSLSGGGGSGQFSSASSSIGLAKLRYRRGWSRSAGETGANGHGAGFGLGSPGAPPVLRVDRRAARRCATAALQNWDGDRRESWAMWSE